MIDEIQNPEIPLDGWTKISTRHIGGRPSVTPPCTVCFITKDMSQFNLTYVRA